VSGSEPPSKTSTPSTSTDSGTPWRIIIFAALAVYAILIVLFNREQVDVSFVFFSARISKLVLILLCVGIGFAGGYLFDELRERRRG
jgi:hypothetical protein